MKRVKLLLSIRVHRGRKPGTARPQACRLPKLAATPPPATLQVRPPDFLRPPLRP